MLYALLLIFFIRSRERKKERKKESTVGSFKVKMVFILAKILTAGQRRRKRKKKKERKRKKEK